MALSESHKAYEAVTKPYQYRDYTIADLRAVFEKVEDSADWKNGFRVNVNPEDVEVVEFAVHFYHGEFPMIKMPMEQCRMWTVISTGYVC